MIFFVIPVFNESKNIPNLKAELLSVLQNENVCYVFSDDGSTDGTKELITSNFEGKNFKVLGDSINRGPGAAFNTAFEWVLVNSKNDNDRIITIEADCTSDILLVPKMLTISNLGFDVILASVYAQGGMLEKTNFFRKFISSVVNLMMRFIFNIKCLTLSSFFRVYSVAILRKIKAANNNTIIKETGFICMLEVLHKAIKLKATVIEVPTTLKSSKRIGKSKMKIIKTSMKYISYLVRNAF
jgi:dolichol-phosphate mannosyltransferase